MDPNDTVLLGILLATLGLTLVFYKRKTPKVRRKFWVRPWLQRRDMPMHKNMLHLYKELLIDGDVQKFRSTLRMDPDVYENLLNLLRPNLLKKHSNFRKPISPEMKLAATLRYLALGDGFRSISQQFLIGLSTSRMVVCETCQVIVKVLQQKYLKTPTTKQQWMQVSTDFKTRWDFPHCLGCVDGKHVRIMAPPKSGTYFFNYKEYLSIVLLAIASADYRFLYIDIGAEGKASDGGVWSKCSFYEHLVDPGNPLNIAGPEPITATTGDMPYVFLGDDAFRLAPYLMKPYPGTGLTMKQQIYNYRVCRARRIVENVFGILTCRFRIFHPSIEVNPSFVEDIVMSTCVLHNFLREVAGSDYLPTVAIDHELDDGTHVAGAWRNEISLQSMAKTTQRNASQYAKEIRNKFADHFVSKSGEIDWQYERALH